MERRRSAGAGPFTVLFPIATLAAILLWLLATAAERAGLRRWRHAGSAKSRGYPRLLLARLLLMPPSGRVHLHDLMLALRPFVHWVANDHDALLAA